MSNRQAACGDGQAIAVCQAISHICMGCRTLQGSKSTSKSVS